MAYSGRTKSLARAQHETVNRRFKIFGCLSHRHDLLAIHGGTPIFRAVANIVQLTIRFGHPPFDIEYDDSDF